MKRGDNLNGSEWIITLVDTILHSSTPLISKVVNNYHFYYYEYNVFLLRFQDLIIITFIIINTMPSC